MDEEERRGRGKAERSASEEVGESSKRNRSTPPPSKRRDSNVPSEHQTGPQPEGVSIQTILTEGPPAGSVLSRKTGPAETDRWRARFKARTAWLRERVKSASAAINRLDAAIGDLNLVPTRTPKPGSESTSKRTKNHASKDQGEKALESMPESKEEPQSEPTPEWTSGFGSQFEPKSEPSPKPGHIPERTPELTPERTPQITFRPSTRSALEPTPRHSRGPAQRPESTIHRYATTESRASGVEPSKSTPESEFPALPGLKESLMDIQVKYPHQSRQEGWSSYKDVKRDCQGAPCRPGSREPIPPEVTSRSSPDISLFDQSTSSGYEHMNRERQVFPGRPEGQEDQEPIPPQVTSYIGPDMRQFGQSAFSNPSPNVVSSAAYSSRASHTIRPEVTSTFGHSKETLIQSPPSVASSSKASHTIRPGVNPRFGYSKETLVQSPPAEASSSVVSPVKRSEPSTPPKFPPSILKRTSSFPDLSDPFDYAAKPRTLAEKYGITTPTPGVIQPVPRLGIPSVEGRSPRPGTVSGQTTGRRIPQQENSSLCVLCEHEMNRRGPSKWRRGPLETQAYLPCGHRFGHKCLFRWIKYQDSVTDTKPNDPRRRCPRRNCIPLRHMCHHYTIPTILPPESDFRDANASVIPSECQFCRTPTGVRLMKDAMNLLLDLYERGIFPSTESHAGLSRKKKHIGPSWDWKLSWKEYQIAQRWDVWNSGKEWHFEDHAKESWRAVKAIVKAEKKRGKKA
ncbi:Fc.00g049350.m01.CDS01 [Cosmosporella sp. VM-42]